ncbi:MAG: GIY-YIG nuclease family protein [Chlorobiaceae bacterium]|nr:GIY-YIG nuclease family protein [Chlorobiaceae bacterium]
MPKSSTVFGSCSLYILYSVSGDRYYTGISSDPYRRLEFHNTKERGYTSRYRPWVLLFIKHYVSRASAREAENMVKNWKSRTMIEQLIAGSIQI